MISDNGKNGSLFVMQLSLATIVVAGVLSLLLLVVVGLHFYRFAHVLPEQENMLVELRARLDAAPDDEALPATYRELDLDARRLRVRWYELASRAGYILVFNLVLLLAGVHALLKMRRRLPAPGPGVKYGGVHDRACAMSRRSVAAASLVLVAAAAVLAIFGPGIDYFEAEETEKAPSVPAPEFTAPPGREEIAANWPRFRGPFGRGVGMDETIPGQWDIETGENILWKSPVPLPGRNSPVVWDGRVFITGASQTRRQVYCYDGATGELLWAGDVPEMGVSASDIELNPDTGYAPATACTDGRMLYAIFPTGDVAAFDYSGKRRWVVNIGKPDNIYGHASSVVGYGDKVIIQYDNGEAGDDLSVLVALDWRSGDTLWRVLRPTAASWTTPLLIETAGHGDQLITSGEPYLIAYDPTDGTELWRADFMSGEIAPSPIYDGGLVMAISPYVAMIAVKPSGSGVIDESDIQWRIEAGIPDIATPVSFDGRVYLLGSYGGALAVHDIADGSPVWQGWLGADFYASPAVAAGRLYLFCVEGRGYVLETGDEFRITGEYPLGEGVYASPAFAEGRMYIRGENNLFCIGYSE